MQGNITAGEVPGLARLLEQEGAYAYTLEMAERLTARAMSALQKAISSSPTACESDASRALEELSHALLKRKN